MKKAPKRALPPGIYMSRGKFQVKIRVGGDMSRSKSFDTLDDAIEHLDLVRRHAAFALAPERKSGLTLGDWIEQWLKLRENGKRHRDVPNDRGVLARYVPRSLRDRGVRELRQRDIRAWLFELSNREATRIRKGQRVGKGTPLSRRTITNALNLLRTCLEDAVHAGKASSNPALNVRAPRAEGVTSEHTGYIPMQQLEKLLTQKDLPAFEYTFYVVALYTGMRIGEICGLRWEDVTLDGPRPEVLVRYSRSGPTKTGKTRRVPLLARAREALEAWRKTPRYDDTTLVFPSHQKKKSGDRTYGKGFDAHWSTWAPKVGIALPMKQLRHSCGCHLVQGTWGPPVPLAVAQAWLGHSSITTTERYYARYAPGHLHAVRETLDAITNIDHQEPR